MCVCMYIYIYIYIIFYIPLSICIYIYIYINMHSVSESLGPEDARAQQRRRSHPRSQPAILGMNSCAVVLGTDSGAVLW